jgi:hypothetical protein
MLIFAIATGALFAVGGVVEVTIEVGAGVAKFNHVYLAAALRPEPSHCLLV